MNVDLRKKENLHVVFWLVKDFAWLADWKWLGLGMAVPTVLLSIWLTIQSRQQRMDFFHNLAVTSWIVGNSMWMIGEFYLDDSIRHWVKPLFVLGFISVAYYYITDYLAHKKTNA